MKLATWNGIAYVIRRLLNVSGMQQAGAAAAFSRQRTGGAPLSSLSPTDYSPAASQPASSSMRRSRAPSRQGVASAAPRALSAVSIGEGRRQGDGAGGDNRQPPLGREDGDDKLSQYMYRSNAEVLSQGRQVDVVRAPVLSFLTVPGTVKRAFKLPGGAKRTDESVALLKRKTLGLRKSFVPIGISKFKVPVQQPPPEVPEVQEEENSTGSTPEDDVPYEPLVLWQNDDPENPHSVSVDPKLCKFLRPHQREGVQFVYECLLGARDFEGNGCILADDMGLGKTLQSITVMWTLLRQGQQPGVPTAKRCIVVCPTSLVKNWESEIDKWLGGDCKCIALSESSRSDVIASIKLYLSSVIYKVLIVSYETFRIHSSRFTSTGGSSCCDLLICDEAHRLKNGDTATSKALASLPCTRRVLLSGTPMQNDLEEFFAMVDFTNPGVLGSTAHFRKHFLNPILAGREPDATESQVSKAQRVQNEMSTIVNEFILRRTNTLNAQHLPPKLVQVVACRLTDVQRRIYRHLLSGKEIRHILNGKHVNLLSSIGNMQKLCNHPRLVADRGADSGGTSNRRRSSSGSAGGGGSANPVFTAEILSMLPQDIPACTGRSSGRLVHPEWSGKMETLFRLMRTMRSMGDDRIVVVSNYTSTLDLIGSMCRENGWPFQRLDGSIGSGKRKKMVDVFNDPTSTSFAFLLSSKAGGCGLNLIGGNRLVLFDPDWNPAVDKQAAARVWRDGQKKRCFVYRFVSTGTIEEKIFQRQLSKEGLQSIVDDQQEVNSLSSKDLRDLFKYKDQTACDTHDKLRCARCKAALAAAAAAKDHEAEAERLAFPQQLALCAEAVHTLCAHPSADAFKVPLDPVALGIEAIFAEKVSEPIDLGTISERIQIGSSSLDDARASGAASYRTIPAFTRDINLLLSIPSKLWDEHELVKAASELKALFDGEWAALAPRMLRIKDDVLSEIRRSSAAKPSIDGPDASNESECGESVAEDVDEDDKSADNQSFQEQIGMPKEEDLNNWSHHISTDTVDDEVFCKAMSGTGDRLVSFIFGLEVTWELLQAQVEEEAKVRVQQKFEREASRVAGKQERDEEEEEEEDSDEENEEGIQDPVVCHPRKNRRVVEDSETSDSSGEGPVGKWEAPNGVVEDQLGRSADSDAQGEGPVETWEAPDCVAEDQLGGTADLDAHDFMSEDVVSQEDRQPSSPKIMMEVSLPLGEMAEGKVEGNLFSPKLSITSSSCFTDATTTTDQNSGVGDETDLQQQWCCPACTYLNSPGKTRCSLCATRPVRKKKKKRKIKNNHETGGQSETMKRSRGSSSTTLDCRSSQKLEPAHAPCSQPPPPRTQRRAAFLVDGSDGDD